jgi:hypothetical protein
MKTLTVATFNERVPAEQLQEQFQRAGVNATIHDESRLERLWFVSEPLAAFHVEVPPVVYLKARQLLSQWEKSTNLMRTAVRCPDCHSSRVEFPQIPKKFITPALFQMLLIGLHVVPREYQCLDCHFTWPKVASVAPELDLLGWPLNSRMWHPERFPKQPK